jgi:hypothetical protein
VDIKLPFYIRNQNGKVAYTKSKINKHRHASALQGKERKMKRITNMNTMRRRKKNTVHDEHIEAKEQRISINRKKCVCVCVFIPKETIK